ncbi:Ubiquinone biosynthesis protein COQ9, mitochondrial [Candida viswanathii]|uniref:Ubiquinone biosynthesis protein n=1 Tax=Candida viswanathii TaxID=5486 RepID=A0A367YJP5_9ASCO|nr:Ubiquinone biosynthesis protein COQ9, mitochondrial [Candida viswanathii]
MLSRCLRLNKRGISPILIRSYHSTDHVGSNTIVNPTSVESRILDASLKYVPEYGFDERCITRAIQELRYPDSMNAAISFSGKSGALRIVEYWLRLQRAKLEEYVGENAEELARMKNDYERLKHLMKVRLLFNEPVLGKLSGGLAQLVVPYNLSTGLEEIHALSDDLAFYSGDDSHDFSWYSKRMGISTIYVSSEMYMLNDNSVGFERTKEFVDDKVGDLEKLGNGYNDVEQWLGFNAISLINLIKSQLNRG